MRITKYLKHLVSLDLGGCSGLAANGLAAIVSNLKDLKKLNLRSCKQISDTEIAKLCGQDIDNNRLAGSSKSHESTENATTSSATEQRGLVSLEFLGLQDCQKLTDDALKHISLGLKNLKSINLSFCSNFSEFGLKHLSSMTELRELTLCSCEVTDQGLRYLSEGSVQLHVLDISFCDKVDQGLVYIAEGMPQLRTLSLNSCLITDDGLVKIAQSLTDLKTLNVGQCSKITDKSLNVIAQHCINLTHIDLYGCQSITTVGLERISQLPHLDHFNLDLWTQPGEKARQPMQHYDHRIVYHHNVHPIQQHHLHQQYQLYHHQQALLFGAYF